MVEFSYRSTNLFWLQGHIYSYEVIQIENIQLVNMPIDPYTNKPSNVPMCLPMEWECNLEIVENDKSLLIAHIQHDMVGKIRVLPAPPNRRWNDKQDLYKCRRELRKLCGFKEENSIGYRIPCKDPLKYDFESGCLRIVVAYKGRKPVHTEFRIKPPKCSSSNQRNWTEFKIKATDPEKIVDWIYKHMDLWRGGPKRDNYDKPARSKPTRSTSAPKSSDKKLIKRKGGRKMSNASESETPTPFGYKISWFAVRCDDPARVASALGIKNPKAAAWNDGIIAAYAGFDEIDGTLFVSPPINGWVLIVGFDNDLDLFSFKGGRANDAALLKLSAEFGEAHYYGSHRVTEAYAWVKAAKGKIVRAFAYVGEAGEIMLDEGAPTPEEKKLGMEYDGEENVPDEENVLDIAAAWSVDPRLSNIPSIPGEGLLGKIK